MASPLQAELLPFKVRDRRVPGWYWAQNEVADVWAPIVGVYGYAVYHILARHARDNEVDGLGVARIAELLVISRSKAFETLKNLEGVGMVARRQKPGGQTTYFLLDLKATPVHRADGYTERHESTVRTTPVRNTDGLADGDGAVNNVENVSTVHGADGGSPPCGLDPSTVRTRNKEARLKDFKTEEPKAGAGAPAVGLDAGEVWNKIKIELKGRMDAETYDKIFRDTWGERIGRGFIFVTYAESPDRDLSVMWRFARDIRGYLAKLGLHGIKPHFVREEARA